MHNIYFQEKLFFFLADFFKHELTDFRPVKSIFLLTILAVNRINNNFVYPLYIRCLEDIIPFITIE